MSGLPGADSRIVVTWALLAVNIAVWGAMEVVGGSSIDPDVLQRFGAMYGPLVAAGEYWRLFTAMFLHAGITHLLFNCFGLFIFGRLVEGVYGYYRFGAIYVMAGLSGGVVSYMFNKTVIAVGASGAIFGVLGALMAYFLVHRNALGDMGRRNLTGLAVVAALNLAIGLIIPNIDNWAHLGGLGGGFVVGLVLAPLYRYQIVETPFGVVRRNVSKLPLGGRWLIVPVVLALLAGLVWVSGSNPTDAEQSVALAVRAERLLADGDHTAALEQAERALELDSRNGLALFMRGKILAEIGANEQAIKDLSAALRMPGLDRARIDEALSLIVALR